MSESPESESEPLLDADVFAWLSELAEREYGGDGRTALNEMLRGMMIAMTEPADPWGSVSAMARWRAQRQGRR